MASYKILKQVDGLYDVLCMAEGEAQRLFDDRTPDSIKEHHYQRLRAIGATLEMLGIIDHGQDFEDAMWDEAREKSKK